MSNLRKVVFTKAEIAPAEAGPAPMLQWVEIEQLVIDDDYQRPLSPPPTGKIFDRSQIVSGGHVSHLFFAHR